MSEEYVSKARTTTITAESKVTLKIKDNFYSVSFSESREIPDVDGVDIETERLMLFDDINEVVDKQAEEIMKTFTKK